MKFSVVASGEHLTDAHRCTEHSVKGGRLLWQYHSSRKQTCRTEFVCRGKSRPGQPSSKNAECAAYTTSHKSMHAERIARGQHCGVCYDDLKPEIPEHSSRRARLTTAPDHLEFRDDFCSSAGQRAELQSRGVRPAAIRHFLGASARGGAVTQSRRSAVRDVGLYPQHLLHQLRSTEPRPLSG